MKERILVTGTPGLVGSYFVSEALNHFEVVNPPASELDLTDKSQVDEQIAKIKPTAVVNFAAITNVDGSEKEKNDVNGITWQVNVKGVTNLAEACKKADVYLAQISTDYVFPGKEGYPGPYAEDAQPAQESEEICWYGWTKIMAEKAVAEVMKTNYSINRIGYPYRSGYEGKTDFARNILDLYDQGKLYPLFADQYLTPSYIPELYEALITILKGRLTGIFHLVSNDATTPLEFGNYLISKARGVENAVKPGSIVEFMKAPGRTPRPVYGGLKSEITQNKLGLKFASWREGIDKFVKTLKS